MAKIVKLLNYLRLTLNQQLSYYYTLRHTLIYMNQKSLKPNQYTHFECLTGYRKRGKNKLKLAWSANEFCTGAMSMHFLKSSENRQREGKEFTKSANASRGEMHSIFPSNCEWAKHLKTEWANCVEMLVKQRQLN